MLSLFPLVQIPHSDTNLRGTILHTLESHCKSSRKSAPPPPVVAQVKVIGKIRDLRSSIKSFHMYMQSSSKCTHSSVWDEHEKCVPIELIYYWYVTVHRFTALVVLPDRNFFYSTREAPASTVCVAVGVVVGFG